MNLSRRMFLGGMTAFAAGGCRSLFTGAAGDYDENLTLFISDMHVSGTDPAYAYTQEKLKEFVAEVLRMDPLPKHIVFFGDLARFHGMKEDYAAAVPLLKPITDAGIELTLGLGNHDRRSFFFEYFPEYAKRTPVPGYAVSVVPLRDCDILMLDSLNPDADKEGGPGAGWLSDSQQEWLKAELPRWKRPVIVGAHHTPGELWRTCGGFGRLLMSCPNVKGYVCGHAHSWRQSWMHRDHWQGPDRVLRYAVLPSLGYWGDIGWAEFRTTPSCAELALKINDFFYARPMGWGESAVTERPPEWNDIVASKRGEKCLFRF